MLRIHFALFLLFFCMAVSAHDILRISTITDRDGLSQNTVRCMMQDSKGFMWMGTVNGLNRYNGKEFVVIQLKNGSTPSLPDNRIRGIMEDSNGFIWVRAFSNTMFCYDPKSESFIDYDPENESKIFSNIKTMTNGDVWLWGEKGCCRVRFFDNKLQAWVPDKDKIQNQPVTFVFEDSKQNIWVGSKEGLAKVTDEQVSFLKNKRFFNAQELENRLFFITSNSIVTFDCLQQSFLPEITFNSNLELSNNRSCLINNELILIAAKNDIYAFDIKKKILTSAARLFQGNQLKDASFYTDNKGYLWVFNMSGTIWRHLQNNTFEPIKLIPQEILSLINLERYQVYHDSRDIIWITTFGNGLFAIDQKNGQTFHYSTEKDLATDYLLSITEDRSGEIWVGTELAGVAKISLTNYPFDIFYPTPKGNSDRDNAVRLIYEDSDRRYWFGTRDGNLHVCDSLLHQAHTHRITGGLPFTMAEDTSGYKWLGTKGDGLLIFPPKGNGNPQTYHLNDRDGQTSSSNNIYTVMRDSKNRMWTASFGGGLHLAERSNNKLTFRQIYFQNKHLNMMRSMIQDHSGLIWVGCNEGVIVFNPDEIIKNESNYINLHLDTKEQQSLSSNEVRVVYEDSKGRIWLGSTGGGLNLLIKKEPFEQSWFKHYDAQNGLSNEMIQAIQEDDEGYIWVSTESGISKFDPQTERFENFIFSNNRQSAIFNELAFWKKKNGELMFGSYNGVYIFDPSKITYNIYAPPVILTGLRINGNNMSPGGQDSPLNQSISSTEKIILKHNQNSFNLEFTMMNYNAPEFNQYMYILEGFEKNWNAMSRNNIATYRNVPPGSYIFKVKGCNSFGVWSDQETTLQIVVNPPWWKSGWAIFLYVVAIAAIAFFVSKMMIKMHRLNMAVEIEKQLTEYKLRFFTNISHEFRTPLTIIRGSIENLNNMENLPSPTKKQLNTLTKSSIRLVRLIDQLLEFRRLQNNKMELNLEPTEVKSFFHDIYLTFKEMAEKKQIEFLFESNESEYNMLLDKSKMDKVAYNLLSNAFKHTPGKGKVVMKLHFSETNDKFTLSISDSGPGVPKEQRNHLFERFKQINYASDGTGIGLHLTSELVKVHKGNIEYTESEYGGAYFVVSVPLSDKNYNKSEIVSNQSAGKVISTIELTSDIEPGEEMFEVSVEKPYKEYKVVIIEDDDEVRAFLESQLEQYFTARTASNGVEGLEKVTEEQPDIVVCDVMMPEMDGYEFTKRLKKNFDTSHVPVILLTAYSSEEHQLKGIQAGADSYITKPFSAKYLLTRIIKLIEQREKLQQKFATEPGLIRSSIGFTDRDKVFLDKLHDIIEENISNADFKIETFAQSFNMSRTTFFRKLKGITGYPPNEYLRIVRMKKAAELLMTTDLNVSEISYKVGISDPFYLSKCFKAQFGKSPSQYRNGQ